MNLDKTGFTHIYQGTLRTLGLTQLATALSRIFSTQIDGIKQIKKGVLHIFGQYPEQKHKKLIAQYTSGISEDRIVAYRSVLENAYVYAKSISGTFNPSYPASQGDSKLHRTLAITKSMLDNLNIWDIVCIQPMQGPVGMVYKLRSGNTGPNPSQINFSIESATVEARTRKCSARLNLEQIQDVDALHDKSVSNEFTRLIGAEIASDMNTEVLTHLYDIASTYEAAFVNGSDRLYLHINRAANDIARVTRRGAGNFAVLSQAALNVLREHPGSHLQLFDNVEVDSKCGIMKVGILNSTIDLYLLCGPLSHDGDDVLIGYKSKRALGDNGISSACEYDGGFILSPYIPYVESEVVIDPNTFQPCVSVMTRYGVHCDQASSNYYIKFNLADPVKKTPEIVPLMETIEG